MASRKAAGKTPSAFTEPMLKVWATTFCFGLYQFSHQYEIGSSFGHLAIVITAVLTVSTRFYGGMDIFCILNAWPNFLGFFFFGTFLVSWQLKDRVAGNEFPRDFLGILLGDQPSKYFLVLRGQRLVVEAESSIQMIMEKLQSYTTRFVLSFEVMISACVLYCFLALLFPLHSDWGSGC